MDKKYEIVWRDPQKTVLKVNYQPSIDWSDGLSANIEAMAAIREVQNDVLLFHDTSQSTIDLLGFGSVHDLFYNKLPRPPHNLKMIVVVFRSPNVVKSVGASIEILDKLFFKRKYAHIVGSLEEAERLIAQAGF